MWVNAKAFMTGKSAFSALSKSTGFIAVALIILTGQWLIVTVGGEMFNVVPLKLEDWGIIIGATSLVLWSGELSKMINLKTHFQFIMIY